MSQYVSIIKDAAAKLLTISRYVVVEGYFMKSTFIEPLQKAGFKLNTKIRSDGNLKELYRIEDCQARVEQKLHYHFNMALDRVSTAKLILWATLKNKEEIPFSMHNIKQYFDNKYLTETIFANLEFDLSCTKINRLYYEYLDIGRIAA
jgi:hypothetical protein